MVIKADLRKNEAIFPFAQAIISGFVKLQTIFVICQDVANQDVSEQGWQVLLLASCQSAIDRKERQ